MKYEWKKQEKNLYLPGEQPALITVPKQKFFMISGEGNPNGEAFSERVSVLYALAYAVRMMPKQGYTPEGYFEYTVYPLEGVWDLTEEGRKSLTLNKDELVYTIMIRQPDFVTQEVAEKAFEITKRKKPNLLLEDAAFGVMEDGLSVQMLHTGTFDTEPESFERMKQFIASHNLERTSLQHREIYLTNVTKVEPSKNKTVLRSWVKSKE